jgi:hypothetical protein
MFFMIDFGLLVSSAYFHSHINSIISFKKIIIKNRNLSSLLSFNNNNI